MEQKPKEMAAENMSAALVETTLRHLKSMKDPWDKVPEQVQISIIDSINRDIKASIRAAVSIIAADKRPTLDALIDSVTVKDGLKATLKLAKSSGFRHELIDQQGQGCLVIITNVGKFLADEKLPKAEKNQRSLFDQAQDKKDGARTPRFAGRKGRGKKA